mmetsp:Transcript_14705/g.34085  ORF Transcript_14705/g.34085 Transcript_14705/m.34085 type:complete len:275 (+) Transcript_14705:1378-2202(+)
MEPTMATTPSTPPRPTPNFTASRNPSAINSRFLTAMATDCRKAHPGTSGPFSMARSSSRPKATTGVSYRTNSASRLPISSRLLHRPEPQSLVRRLLLPRARKPPVGPCPRPTRPTPKFPPLLPRRLPPRLPLPLPLLLRPRLPRPKLARRPPTPARTRARTIPTFASKRTTRRTALGSPSKRRTSARSSAKRSTSRATKRARSLTFVPRPAESAPKRRAKWPAFPSKQWQPTTLQALLQQRPKRKRNCNEALLLLLLLVLPSTIGQSTNDMCYS